MLHRAASNAYSWWWASHIRTKQSKWLEQNLQDMEEKVQNVLKLIEEDGDSFAKRAEMYYKKRPELIHFVEESYRAYRALAERYDHISTELQNANNTIAYVFPEQVQFAMEEDEDEVPRNQKKSQQGSKGNIPKVPKIPNDKKGVFPSAAAKKFQSKKSMKATKSTPVAKSGLSKAEGLQEIDSLQKQILALQTEKEFAKSSYECGLAKYWEIDQQIREMQDRIGTLQDEFGAGTVIEDDEARTLMASAALKSCQETIAQLEEKQEKSAEEASVERKRINHARERITSLKNDFLHGQIDQEKTQAKDASVKAAEDSKNMGQKVKNGTNEKQDLELLRKKIKEQFEVGSSASLTVTELAEKIDELVNKVIGLEAAVSSQTALIQRLRTETDDLQTQIRTLEDDKASLIDGKNDLSEKLREMEGKLRGLQELDKSVEDQKNNLQTHFTEAQCNLDHLSEKLHNVKPDEELPVTLQTKESSPTQLESLGDSPKKLQNLKEVDRHKVSDESKEDSNGQEGEPKSGYGHEEHQNEEPDQESKVSDSAQKKEESPAEGSLQNLLEGQEKEPNQSNDSEKVSEKKSEEGGIKEPDEELPVTLQTKKSSPIKLESLGDNPKELQNLKLVDRHKVSDESKEDSSGQEGELKSGYGRKEHQNLEPDQESKVSDSAQKKEESPAEGSLQNLLEGQEKEPNKSNDSEKVSEKKAEEGGIKEPDEELPVTLQTKKSSPIKLVSLGDNPKELQNLKLVDGHKVSDESKEDSNGQEGELKSGYGHKEHQNLEPDQESKVSDSAQKKEEFPAEGSLQSLLEGREKEPSQYNDSEMVSDKKAGEGGIKEPDLGTSDRGNDADNNLETSRDQNMEKKVEKQASPNTLGHMLDVGGTLDQATSLGDEPNWKQLFMSGLENREKTLLTEYTAILRNYKDVKKRLSEVEKKSNDNHFDTTVQLRELKIANAKKDEQILYWRQKLSLLQAGLGKDNESEKSMTDSPTIEATEDINALLMEEPETSGIEKKFRIDIDEVLEENLDFWFRFSTTIQQIQKFETEIQDLQSELLKIENKQKEDGSSTAKYSLKSDAKPLYKYLREIHTELSVWLEKSMLLKDELKSRFSSLCSIQEEITTALKESAEDDEIKFTSYQAAKFQGEILNMKQENNKVADELQAGLDHVTTLQLEVEKALAKLNEDFKLSGSKNRQNMQLPHSESRSRVPLRSFIFGVKSKKQKASIFSCMHPTLHRKYNAFRPNM